MTIGKREAKGHTLLWLGLAMIAAAIILTLVGTFLLGRSGGYSAPTSEAGVPESLTEARDTFEQAVSNSYGDSNLEVVDVMEFTNNYYAQVRESDTGIGAMELLIDKRTGWVRPEPGPNMMWNTKYGMMSGRGMMGPNDDSYEGMMGPGGRNGGGMMGGSYQPAQVSPNDQLPITPEDATQVAKDYLTRVSAGTEAEEPDQFYGYYTLNTVQDGEVTGMLSVNGYTGQVWYHTWHGPFIAMEEEVE